MRALRIARARSLADGYPAAASVLRFYAALVEYQHSLIDPCQGTAVDGEGLFEVIPAFLEWLEREAPASLATSAIDLRRLSAADWRTWFGRAFTDPSEASATDDHAALFVVEALLQPRAEQAALARPHTAHQPENPQTEGRCPVCAHLPVVGVLREEGHGARRALVCGRCATEWAFRRVSCPGCGEQDFDTLPVYTAEQFPHIRVEACDRCRRYLKAVDLSKDGLAVPQVDDLASLPLDLWARAEGYVRLRANLLRT